MSGAEMSESELGQMPPEVSQAFEARMKEAGFVKLNEFKEPMEMAFAAGAEAALTHKTCERPDCKQCDFRRGIDAEGFKRGLEKGMALGAQEGAQQVAAQ